MIEYKFGNIFSTGMNTIVCPVNTVGVMGAGLALTIKAIYPELFKKYKEFCKAGALDIGKLYFSQGRRKKHSRYSPRRSIGRIIQRYPGLKKDLRNS